MKRQQMGPEPVRAPVEVHERLELIRRSGVINLPDRPGVTALARETGLDVVAGWAESEPSEYAQAIFRGLEPVEQGDGR